MWNGMITTALIVGRNGLQMTEIEKLNERLESIEQAITATQHAASVDRKLSHDKHLSGHFTKALTELTTLKTGLQALIKRYETVGK